MPENKEDWQKATAQEAIKKHEGVDNFFKAVTDFYQFPIMVAQGTSKQRLIREEQRPYLETTKIKIYGADYLKDKQTDYACLGFEESSNEVYQFVLSNKEYTRDLIRKNQGQSIKELTLSEALRSIQEIATTDKDAKKRDRIISWDFPHMQIKAYVRRRAYRVIANSQRDNRY